uniref:Uncharacterized protein n=1 Tax=Arundo donax TaxID=35708 RepID=A0A0A9CPB4_ARUDO
MLSSYIFTTSKVTIGPRVFSPYNIFPWYLDKVFLDISNILSVSSYLLGDDSCRLTNKASNSSNNICNFDSRSSKPIK